MKLRPIFKTHGGKNYVKSLIISLFPENYQELNYYEPCCGACSVFLNKLPSKHEVLNDIDKSIYNLLYCLKNFPDQFISMVDKIPYTLEVFNEARLVKREGIFDAINELIVRRFSRGGLKKSFSWSERTRGGRKGDVNAWETFKLILPDICQRLQNVELKNINVFDILNKVGKDDFLYIDPPYLPKTRSVGKIYDHEMTEEDHIKLAEMLNNSKSKVLLSGYPSKLYDKLYNNWDVITKEVPNHSSQSIKKQRRLEVLWKNY